VLCHRIVCLGNGTRVQLSKCFTVCLMVTHQPALDKPALSTAAPFKINTLHFKQLHGKSSEMEIIMKAFFVLSDLKTYCLDEFKVENNRNCFFFGAVAPELFYAEATGLQHDGYNIKSVILKDFIGHDLSDVKGSSLLLQLAFPITVGDYDKEYQ